MMTKIKLISTILLVSFLQLGYSQEDTDVLTIPVNEETELITYKEVVEEQGTKEEFFNRAIEWINGYYKNPVDVTKVRDPESGEIKGLHRIKLKRTDKSGNVTDGGVVQYRFFLEFKENRYRYTLTEFAMRGASKYPAEKWLNKNEDIPKNNLRQIDEFALSWIEDLKKGMKPKVEKNDDDW